MLDPNEEVLLNTQERLEKDYRRALAGRKSLSALQHEAGFQRALRAYNRTDRPVHADYEVTTVDGKRLYVGIMVDGVAFPDRPMLRPS